MRNAKMFTSEMELIVRSGKPIKVLEPSSDGYPGRTLCMIKKDWYLPTTAYFASLWYHDHSRIVRYGMNDPLALFEYLNEMVGSENYPPDVRFSDASFAGLWNEGYKPFEKLPYTHIVNVKPDEIIYCWNGKLFQLGETLDYTNGESVFG